MFRGPVDELKYGRPNALHVCQAKNCFLNEYDSQVYIKMCRLFLGLETQNSREGSIQRKIN